MHVKQSYVQILNPDSLAGQEKIMADVIPPEWDRMAGIKTADPF